MPNSAFHVVKVAVDSAQWAVRRDGMPGELTTHENRNQAVATAHGIAEINRPCRVVLHYPNGTIETEFLYDADGSPPRERRGGPPAWP